MTIKNLSIYKKNTPLILDACVDVLAGESVGLFGKSGSGKSVFSLFLLGLLPEDVFSVSADEASFFHKSYSFNFLSKNANSWNRFRSKNISMVFQDPSISLNPTIRCGKQVEEALVGFGFGKKSSVLNKKKCIDLFLEVGLVSPEKIYSSYPHQLSGGQKQRVVVAIALAGDPKLLIADEPTTSLDPLTQKGVLDLILKIKKNRSIGVLLISHDLALVNYFCDKVFVFKDCFFHESSLSSANKYLKKKALTYKKIKNREFVFDDKKTIKKSFLKFSKKELGDKNLFVLKNVSVFFGVKKVRFFALKNISFSLGEKDVLGVVGGSGSGKTTLGRVLCGIEGSYTGSFSFPQERGFLKKSVQMVYQDPFSSFNPKYTVGDSVSEIIALYGSSFSVDDLFGFVDLEKDLAYRYPHQLSGGQKQRVSIARVLATEPRVIVFDESLSALDIETQYSILKLIRFININFYISVVFISHNMSSVYYLCNKIIVLRRGEIVDDFNVDDLFLEKRNSYTKEIIKNSFVL